MNQKSTFKLLGLPDIAIEYVFGERSYNLDSISKLPESSSNCYPPAFIPLWKSRGSVITLGMWKMCYTDYSPSFVKMVPEISYRMYEYGRTYEQFICVILLQEVCLSEGVTESIEDFAIRNGVMNVDSIDQITDNTGEDVVGLNNHNLFVKDVPLEIIADVSKYDGKFPTDYKLFDGISNSSLEYNSSMLNEIRKGRIGPEWFHDGSAEIEFYKLVDQGLLKEAWVVLNSNGWSMAQVRKALSYLLEKSDDELFVAIAKDWQSLPHRDEEAY